MNPVFVTGGSGLLALSWALALRDRYPVTLGLHQRHVALAGVDTHPSSLDTVDQIVRAFDVVQPGMVVHTAGLTNIERCEADPRRAQYANVELAANVAVACARRGLPLVHVSTDHLFSGDEAFVSEIHPAAPQNVYGRTKAEAELRVLDAHFDALVVRTNFYGWGPRYRRSFSDMIVDALRKGDAITLFTDVLFTPILTEVLSRAVHDLVDLKTNGIVHVVGDERISKYDFGLKVARHFQQDVSLIRPGLLADQPALVQRPHDMSLSNAKACGLLGRPLGDVEAHLMTLHQQEQRGQAKELQSL
jgi:dTDP-4-dehydrorhamnose reductase